MDAALTKMRDGRIRIGPARNRTALTLWVLAAFALGLLIRAYFVLPRDFPLSDGGLFYTMIREVQGAGYALPWYTSYNAAGIPYAYPPLGLYVAALLDDLTTLALLDILRYLPMVLDSLIVLAVALLAHGLLRSPAATAFAALAYAVMPGFEWGIMGGGLTRSLGLLFAVLTVYAVHRMYSEQQAKHVVLAAVFGGLTVLSHPSLTWFACYTAAFVLVASGRTRRGLLYSIATVVGVGLLTAPWWLTVLVRHGVGPLLAAAGSGSALVYGMTYLMTLSHNAFHSLAGVAGLAGIIPCLIKRQYLLPIWLLATFLLDPRKAHSTVTVPLALLAAVGLAYILGPVLKGRAGDAASDGEADGSITAWLQSLLATGVIVLLVGQGFVAAADWSQPRLRSLPAEERAAMAWVADNTPPDSGFIVINGPQTAWDGSSEWFPALAGRTSVATYQGYEWLGLGNSRFEAGQKLQLCAYSDAGCLEDWAQSQGVTFTHVYVACRADAPNEGDPDKCAQLRNALSRDPEYGIIYDLHGVTVFQRLEDY